MKAENFSRQISPSAVDELLTHRCWLLALLKPVDLLQYYHKHIHICLHSFLLNSSIFCRSKAELTQLLDIARMWHARDACRVVPRASSCMCLLVWKLYSAGLSTKNSDGANKLVIIIVVIFTMQNTLWASIQLHTGVQYCSMLGGKGRVDRTVYKLQEYGQIGCPNKWKWLVLRPEGEGGKGMLLQLVVRRDMYD